jgi:hypothetical protein
MSFYDGILGIIDNWRLPGKQKVFPSNLRDKCVTVMKTNKGENINNNLKSSIVLVQILPLEFSNILSNTLTCCVMSFYDGILGIIDNWSLSCNLNSWCFK